MFSVHNGAPEAVGHDSEPSEGDAAFKSLGGSPQNAQRYQEPQKPGVEEVPARSYTHSGAV